MTPRNIIYYIYVILLQENKHELAVKLTFNAKECYVESNLRLMRQQWLAPCGEIMSQMKSCMGDARGIYKCQGKVNETYKTLNIAC